MKELFKFLNTLEKNNDRDWFKENIDTHQLLDKDLKVFANDLATHVKKHDNIDMSKIKVYRIYRDVRFSKNKTPYKTNRSIAFTRASNALRGGYYLQLQAGRSFIAGGFWGPNSKDLLHIRNQIDQEPELLRDVLNKKEIKNYFGELKGEQVKTSPKGFSIESPAIDLLRYKQFILTHQFTDKEVVADDFIEKVNKGFKTMRPFLDVMSEILTTDLNGVPLTETKN